MTSAFTHLHANTRTTASKANAHWLRHEIFIRQLQMDQPNSLGVQIRTKQDL